MVLKKGDRGESVKKVQSALGINADGLFGIGTEKAVIEFQKKNGLNADGIVGSYTWSKMFGNEMQAVGKAVSNFVVYAPLTKKITHRKRDIKYILIHFTLGTTSKVGSAKNTRNYFQNSARNASADFVIDDGSIVQCNPDLDNNVTWQCGDGNGKYGITNTNSIGIELCSSLKPGCCKDANNHEGWYFTESVLNNCVKLVNVLKKKYPHAVIARHYDASRKNCPGLVGWNDGDLKDPKTGKKTGKKNNSHEWIKFKLRLV